jgi:hypothetical protein
MSDAEERSRERDVERTVERELDAAKDKLPPRVLAAIAAAARAGNLGRARDALLEFRAERPDEAAAAAQALRAYAPFVSAALADALEPPARSPSSSIVKLWPLLVVVVLALVAVRLARVANAPPPAPQKIAFSVAPAADPTREFQRFEDSLYPDADAAERVLRQRVESAGEAIERALPGHDEISVVALEVESSARRGDCATLKARAPALDERALATITDAAARDASADLRALVATFDAALAALCR